MITEFVSVELPVASYPAIWEGYLLDQARSLTSSQVALDTVWLPRSYHAMKGDLGSPRATILHDSRRRHWTSVPIPALQASCARPAAPAPATPSW
ncbi:hypothetical protein [Bradyrhizobium cajani]|uniref:hypothetical protein n=1 Tax=Bradyrhizobium cajani TaxID=1928661 RepID=UPI00142EAD56|nr:hypothetical protein [Bradyrhizobium cajani]MCP3374117.1 hypothetical protein [Bradyrhizobium cajani]